MRTTTNIPVAVAVAVMATTSAGTEIVILTNDLLTVSTASSVQRWGKLLDVIKVTTHLFSGWSTVLMEDKGYDDGEEWGGFFDRTWVLQVNWKPGNALARWYMDRCIQVNIAYIYCFYFIFYQDWIKRQFWNRDKHNEESEPCPIQLEARTSLLWKTATAEYLHWSFQRKPEGILLWGSTLQTDYDSLSFDPIFSRTLGKWTVVSRDSFFKLVHLSTAPRWIGESLMPKRTFFFLVSKASFDTSPHLLMDSRFTRRMPGTLQRSRKTRTEEWSALWKWVKGLSW